MKNEVWRVKMKSREYVNENREYFVFAKSAAMAEKAGLRAAKQDKENDKLPSPYCQCAEFHCYVV